MTDAGWGCDPEIIGLIKGNSIDRIRDQAGRCRRICLPGWGSRCETAEAGNCPKPDRAISAYRDIGDYVIGQPTAGVGHGEAAPRIVACWIV